MNFQMSPCSSQAVPHLLLGRGPPKSWRCVWTAGIALLVLEWLLLFSSSTTPTPAAQRRLWESLFSKVSSHCSLMWVLTPGTPHCLARTSQCLISCPLWCDRFLTGIWQNPHSGYPLGFSGFLTLSWNTWHGSLAGAPGEQAGRYSRGKHQFVQCGYNWFHIITWKRKASDLEWWLL